jgi:hypothetical protein
MITIGVVEMSSRNVPELAKYIEAYIDNDLWLVGLSARLVDNPKPSDYSWRAVGVVMESDNYASNPALRGALRLMMRDILEYNSRPVVQFFQNDPRELGSRYYTPKYGIAITPSVEHESGFTISWKVTNE